MFTPSYRSDPRDLDEAQRRLDRAVLLQMARRAEAQIVHDAMRDATSMLFARHVAALMKLPKVPS